MIDMLRPALIAGLVLTEVGLWQWRVLIASRGNRGGAVALGANGPVTVLTLILNRRHEARLHRDVTLLDPHATWRAEDVRKRPSTDAPRPPQAAERADEELASSRA